MPASAPRGSMTGVAPSRRTHQRFAWFTESVQHGANSTPFAQGGQLLANAGDSGSAASRRAGAGAARCLVDLAQNHMRH